MARPRKHGGRFYPDREWKRPEYRLPWIKKAKEAGKMKRRQPYDFSKEMKRNPLPIGQRHGDVHENPGQKKLRLENEEADREEERFYGIYNRILRISRDGWYRTILAISDLSPENYFVYLTASIPGIYVEEIRFNGRDYVDTTSKISESLREIVNTAPQGRAELTVYLLPKPRNPYRGLKVTRRTYERSDGIDRSFEEEIDIEMKTLKNLP